MSNYKKLSAENFELITRVFINNKWELECSNDSIDRFNRFCALLSLLENEEQKLVIELTKRFYKITCNEYLAFFYQLISTNSDLAKELNKYKRVLFLPLLAPKDFKKSKSSRHVWYLLQSEEIVFNKTFKDKKLEFLDINEVSGISTTLTKDDKIVLVDDYIGSGKTAKEAIEWLNKKYNIGYGKIMALALSAQESGINFLNENGVKVYANFIFKRGITDYYFNDELTNNIKIMRNIEKKLNIKNFNFGYKKSEALISLIRTPNNTFPVFWWPHLKNNTQPPFHREI